jgi:hypothetical protein
MACCCGATGLKLYRKSASAESLLNMGTEDGEFLSFLAPLQGKAMVLNHTAQYANRKKDTETIWREDFTDD